MSEQTQASLAEVFREAIASCGNACIIEMAEIAKWRKWYDADDWMEAATEDYILERLRPEKVEAFHELMHIGIMLDESPRNPKGFMHPALPKEELVLCARIYRTPMTLRRVALNPSPRMPRKDIYIAWKLGLITDAELEAVPPLFCGKKIQQRKTAWQKK